MSESKGGCLSLVIPLVGHSWSRWHEKTGPVGSPEQEMLYPSYLDERVPRSVGLDEEIHAFLKTQLSKTLLQETYNPQLKLGSHLAGTNDDMGSCLWMWSRHEDYFVLLRMFPTGGGTITLHKPLPDITYKNVSSEVLRFSDHSADSINLRARLHDEVVVPLVKKVNDQLMPANKVHVIGTRSHFPVYAITTLSGIEHFAAWTDLPETGNQENRVEEQDWSIERLAQLAGRVLHNGEDVGILNIPRVSRHLSDDFPPATVNFSLDKRVILMVGRRGAAIVSESFGHENQNFPDYIAGSLVNLIEIMWNRLFTLVWLNGGLDTLTAQLDSDIKRIDMHAIQHELYRIRRSLFLILKDPGCYLFDGGSVTDVADFLLERFWIARQEELLKSKISLLDDLLASWQVLRAMQVQGK